MRILVLVAGLPSSSLPSAYSRGPRGSLGDGLAVDEEVDEHGRSLAIDSDEDLCSISCGGILQTCLELLGSRFRNVESVEPVELCANDEAVAALPRE